METNNDFMSVVMNASVTDWIQAILVLVAIIGAIAAFAVVFRRDRKHLKSIGILTEYLSEGREQTRELVNQSQELIAQTRMLREANQVNTRYYEAVIRSLREDMERKELPELEVQKQKIAVKPTFTGSATYRGTQGDMTFRIRNIGMTAHNVQIRNTEEGEVIFTDYDRSRMPEGAELAIDGRLKDKGASINQRPYSFLITFEDELGTVYQQRVERQEASQSSISVPQEVGVGVA